MNARVLLKKSFTFLFLGFSLYAQQDPFQDAHALYSCSEWQEAKDAYERVFEAIKQDAAQADQKMLAQGHVGYADVLWATAAADWYDGKTEQAMATWIDAGTHRDYRLELGQFGRKPLGNEEWDGSDPRGKTIVVYSERDGGAFGDTFAMSFLPRYLKEKGAIVVFVPQKPLKNMYEAQGTIQSAYIDKVVLRDEELPPHDAKIYLWSIFSHMIKDCVENQQVPFPVAPWLSGVHAQEYEEKLQEYVDNGDLLVGFWYRSSNNLAADNRFLDRNLGANRILEALQGIPGVTLVNFEGMGHYPITRDAFNALVNKGDLDEIDICDSSECDPSLVVQLDKNIPFLKAAAIGQFIVQNGGVLTGCDTGLLNLFAAIKAGNNVDKQSVLAILNAQADFRWGSKKEVKEDGSLAPRVWYLSDMVKAFQAPQQGDFATPLAQVKKDIEERAREHQKMIQERMAQK